VVHSTFDLYLRRKKEIALCSIDRVVAQADQQFRASATSRRGAGEFRFTDCQATARTLLLATTEASSGWPTGCRNSLFGRET
jgi:hypothetical protein